MAGGREGADVMVRWRQEVLSRRKIEGGIRRMTGNKPHNNREECKQEKAEGSVVKKK